MARSNATAPSLFDEPAVDMTRPAVDRQFTATTSTVVSVPSIPIAGISPGARHASASGAEAASKNRKQISEAYLELFTGRNAAGVETVFAFSDHEVVEELKRRFQIFTSLSSINSTRSAYNVRVPVGEPLRIVDSGTYEDHTFSSGAKTKRTRWIPRDLLDRFLEQLDRDQKLTAEIRAHVERVRNERRSFPEAK